MKNYQYLFSFAIVILFTLACKDSLNTTTKEVAIVAKMETVSLAVSGMTCEIGCAKTIQSKLSKKKGVTDAKVVFADSIATVVFDANVTSKKDLISFVNSIAGGNLYTASEIVANSN